jgi:RNA polymerase sigma-B factor
MAVTRLTSEHETPLDRPGRRGQRGREDLRLFRRLREGDLVAREALARRFMPLARTVASRYRERGVALDDLVQVAALGLVKAIDRFDPERGMVFSSYAVPTMLGEIKRHFRDTGWSLHVSRPQQEQVLRVVGASRRMESTLGRTPTIAELAAELGESREAVLEARDAAWARSTVPLDAPLGDDPDGGTYADSVGALDDRFELAEDRSVFAGTIAALPRRDRWILSLRFHHGLTQSEIATHVGISQMHVSRILRRTLDRLRVVAAGC